MGGPMIMEKRVKVSCYSYRVLMHFESNRGLYAGSADVPVRHAPTGAKYNGAISSFALIADEDVRVPSKMILLDSELNLFLSHG
jgi:hypothetical protein